VRLGETKSTMNYFFDLAPSFSTYPYVVQMYVREYKL
jgi:hypothetical protein